MRQKGKFMTLKDLIDHFNTTPFLFIGSGISRRYLGLPNWRNLLEHFAKEIKDDEFSYSYYENKAKEVTDEKNLMPKIATLIENDYNDVWYKRTEKRHLNDKELEMVKGGTSPFKAEIAAYIKSSSKIQSQYQDEIDMLQKISENSIAGVITTNYDTFLEDHFDKYKTYVGQKQLIFSALQGVAEIYKIHGSVEVPSSIVIDEKDYQEFESKEKYLAAKLMTIFVEYPIIFMGYSISDMNVQSIIRSIVECLDQDQISQLSDRFVFVEYMPNFSGVQISSYTIMVDDRPLFMKKVTVSDFSLIYKALEAKKTKMPVRLLRHFKEELYRYVITSTPTSTMRVASIEDERIKDDDFVLAIGKASQLGLRGLSGLDASEWYRSIVLDDLDFSADELLTYAFPKLNSQNSGRLPVNKLLAYAERTYPEAEQVAKKYDFDNIISTTIKKNRKIVARYDSVNDLWNDKEISQQKKVEWIAYLTEEQIDVNELEDVLKALFANDKDILVNAPQAERTSIRRLIRIYDYLKWGKSKKELSD